MKVPDCLITAGPLTESDLADIEALAFAADTVAHRTVQRLLIELRRVKHELDDPAFRFAGGRIHRHAILCREAEIDGLREKIIASTSKG